MEKTNVILVEDQTNIREVILFSLQCWFNFKVHEFSSINSAIEYLDTGGEALLVICDHSLEDQDSFDLFKYIVDQDQNVPFISTSADLVGHFEEYKGKKITASVKKEDAVEPLNNIIKEIFSITDAVEYDQYTSFAIKTLKHFTGLSEDAYIKLISGRFLKLFSEGDLILEDDIKKYSNKNVNNLYFKRESYTWILRKINEDMPQIISNPNFKVDVAHPFFEQGKGAQKKAEQEQEIKEAEEIKEALTEDSAPNKEENAEFTAPEEQGPFSFEEKFINKVHNKGRQALKMIKKNKKINKFLKSLNGKSDEANYMKTRIGIVSNISCAIAKDLGWGSDATYEKLIYVAYLHDITLFKDLTLAKIQTLEDLEEADLPEDVGQKVLKHPLVAAKIISEDPKAPQDADMIIQQHHERPERKGFPYQLHTQRIAPMAAVIGVSIDFAQYILENPNWKFDNYTTDFKKKFNGGIFNKIYISLRKLSKM
jgi:response regulator RpfG family c-di-GMP phosphodiesterase